VIDHDYPGLLTRWARVWTGAPAHAFLLAGAAALGGLAPGTRGMPVAVIGPVRCGLRAVRDLTSRCLLRGGRALGELVGQEHHEHGDPDPDEGEQDAPSLVGQAGWVRQVQADQDGRAINAA
jgi:hypothetical protein